MELSEEEKKAIKILQEEHDVMINPKLEAKYTLDEVIEALYNVIMLIRKQQKEIDFYKKEELGYIAGYEDGKRHKQTAVVIKNENAQQELFQKEIVRLKERIEKQQKEIEELKSKL